MRNEIYRFGICKECYECRLNKYIYNVDLSGKEKEEYTRKQLEVLENLDPNNDGDDLEIALSKLYRTIRKDIDYDNIKTYYNQKLLKLYPTLEERVNQSGDPLLLSLKYSLVGNYIDFDAQDSVSDEQLLSFIDKADERQVNEKFYDSLKNDLSNAKSLVVFLDNCGEIVFDKLFISQIKKHYPSLTIYGLVRRDNSYNDATMKDAKEVGLDEVCIALDNGNRLNKIEFDRMDPQRKKLVDEADLIISKGQANAEMLFGCKRNIYYILLCKCNHFAKEFNCKRFDSILEKELHD